MTTGTYYWNAHPNFGDLLTPLLGKHFAGLDIKWASPRTADLVIVGSVLDTLPYGWRGIIAGSGKLHENTSIRSLRNCLTLGVRGKLTALQLPGNPIIGDPALLADELVSVEQKYDLGIVPHWTDQSLVSRFEYLSRHYSVKIIRPSVPPLDAVRAIGECRKIVSSSLHGIIVADAFGIPRRAERFPKMDNSPFEGRDFKWRDYGSSIGQPIKFGTLQWAPRERVEALQVDLFEMFQQLKKESS